MSTLWEDIYSAHAEMECNTDVHEMVWISIEKCATGLSTCNCKYSTVAIQCHIRQDKDIYKQHTHIVVVTT